ncbi:MAG: KilA-N domain-containing protein [Bacteroidales bacterium]|nr:KilA-N domain-containing protein [Bacteroidales bacterium]
MEKMDVNGVKVSLIKVCGEDYISLTDMMRSKEGDFFFHNWLRNRNTVEFLGVWEKVNNPEFNSVEFDMIKSKAGLNSFRLSVKEWMEKTSAIGIVSKAGRYGGTYAHKDIAFEFAMWISPEFKVYLIREFQRLKDQEQKLIGWSAKRELAKINYRIHTDAIKQNLIPSEVSDAQVSFIYANEADVLNVALFGMTAKEWRDINPSLNGNIRDYATINQLICLSNLENLNSILISDGVSQSDRLRKLNTVAIYQMSVLADGESSRKLLK